MEGVVKAISPNSSLRSYILTLPERSLSKLRKILRVFFQEKNTSDLYQELLTTCQGPKETSQQFFMRLLDARNKVLFASKEEGSEEEYGTHLVQNAFLKALETGLRDENLLTNIRPLLRSQTSSDEDLMELVNELSSVQTQRRLKISTQGKAHVVSVNAEPDSLAKSNPATDQLGRAFAEIKELRAELAALRGHQGNDPQTSTNATPTSLANPNHMQRQDAPTQYSRKELAAQVPQLRDGYTAQPFCPQICSICQRMGYERCNHCFKCGRKGHNSRYCRNQSSMSGNWGSLLARDNK